MFLEPHSNYYKMILSGCISITKPSITLASLPNNSSQPTTPKTPPKVSTLKRNSPKQTQPSVAEVERAIGAGIYRDRDPDSDTGQNKSVMDVVLSNSIGKTEGSTERKLRETGEWISTRTEKATRSSGKKILEVMFLWIAPAWLFLFLVATGAIKLPSKLSALNDFIM